MKSKIHSSGTSGTPDKQISDINGREHERKF